MGGYSDNKKKKKREMKVIRKVRYSVNMMFKIEDKKNRNLKKKRKMK